QHARVVLRDDDAYTSARGVAVGRRTIEARHVLRTQPIDGTVVDARDAAAREDHAGDRGIGERELRGRQAHPVARIGIAQRPVVQALEAVTIDAARAAHRLRGVRARAAVVVIRTVGLTGD